MPPGLRSGAFISIHALRVEGDAGGEKRKRGESDFYPRPPGGGRHKKYKRRRFAGQFLSTPSGWRATIYLLHVSNQNGISIHALRVEGDLGRQIKKSPTARISIHALRVEGDSSKES